MQILSGAVLAAFIALAPLQAVAADASQGNDSAAVKAANDIMDVFAEACLRNLMHPERTKDWAVLHHLAEIESPAARSVYIGDGDDGIGWAMKTDLTTIVVAIRSKTQSCAIYGDRADPATFAKWYDFVLAALARPADETSVETPEPDKLTDGPYGKRTGKVRLVLKKGKMAVLVLMTNEKPGGPYQVSMQVRAADKDKEKHD